MFEISAKTYPNSYRATQTQNWVAQLDDPIARGKYNCDQKYDRFNWPDVWLCVLANWMLIAFLLRPRIFAPPGCANSLFWLYTPPAGGANRRTRLFAPQGRVFWLPAVWIDKSFLHLPEVQIDLSGYSHRWCASQRLYNLYQYHKYVTIACFEEIRA